MTQKASSTNSSYWIFLSFPKCQPLAGHCWRAKMGRGKINNQKWGGAKIWPEGTTFWNGVFCPKNDPTNPARRYDILKWLFFVQQMTNKSGPKVRHFEMAFLLSKKIPKMTKSAKRTQNAQNASIPFHSTALHSIDSISLFCCACDGAIDVLRDV